MKLNLRVLSIAVAVSISMLGAVLLADPSDLGISPVAARWLSIISVGLGILQGFLPRVQGPTTDPNALADRIWDLPAEDREMVARILSERAEDVARIDAERAVHGSQPFFQDAPPAEPPDQPAFLRRGGSS